MSGPGVPTYRVILEEGVVTAVRTPEGSARPDPFPQFIVREYTQTALDGNHPRGTDEEGRAYCEYRVPGTDEGDADPVEIHSLLVQEAQALTDHGHARGEYRWILSVVSAPVVPEFESLSDGLSGVIRQARARGYLNVLLDRDAHPLNGIPTYPW